MNQFFIVNTVIDKEELLHLVRSHRIAHSYALKHTDERGKAFRKELRNHVQQTIVTLRAHRLRRNLNG